MWTEFYDGHSGGEPKMKWSHILIEAGKEFATLYFKYRFQRDPDHVTCECCGKDYVTYEHNSLEEFMAEYEKATKYQDDCSLLVIRKSEMVEIER